MNGAEVLQKFPEYALKVYYPFGGEHFIIRWYEYNEGHHLILAKSEKMAEQTFAMVLNEEPHLEIKDYFRCNIVAPPEALCQAYALGNFESDVRTFQIHFNWLAKDYFNKHKKLPSKMKWCPAYSNPETKESDDLDHYECNNCKERITLTEGTIEDLYLKHRKAFLFDKQTYIDKKLCVSRAPQADLTQDLHLARSNLESISYGIDMIKDLRESPLTGILFVYQNPVDVDRSAVDAMVAVKQLEWKQKREAQKKFDEQFKKEYEENKYKDLLAYFD